jgi:predicted MFS family arabinose efflux permease
MGQGFGALIMVPITQTLIDKVGWRSTLMITGTVILLALLPANALLQRRCPQDVGQFPDGAPSLPSGISGKDGKHSGSRDWSMREALASIPFWCIAIGQLALGTALFLINTHFVAHLVSLGYDKLLAAFIFGLIGFVRIGGTVLWGMVSDRIGRGRAYGVAILVTLLGLSFLIMISIGSPLWFVYFSAVLYSIGHSAGTPIYGSVIADIFSGRKVGLIFGLLEVSFGLGSALGAWTGGFLFDITGSYTWPLCLCLFCFAISGLAIHACLKWQAQHALDDAEPSAVLAG